MRLDGETSRKLALIIGAAYDEIVDIEEAEAKALAAAIRAKNPQAIAKILLTALERTVVSEHKTKT